MSLYDRVWLQCATTTVRCDECVRGRVGKRRCRACNGSGHAERFVRQPVRPLPKAKVVP
jgi:hypothetical protein